MTGDRTHALKAEGADGSEDGTGRGTPIIPALSVALRGREGGATAELGGEQAGTLRASSGGGDKPYVLVPHVVAPPLTATNDPSRSPQSAEVTAQVSAVLRATHSSSIGIDTYNGTITGNVAATLSTGSATTTGSGPSVLQPRASFWNGSDIAEALTCTSDDQRMPDKGRMQMVLQTMSVRRLTPEECEALQGFARGFTLIPWKGKPPELCPDGPRYRALGNSMAVPVIRWIGVKLAERIALASSTAAH